MLSWLKRIMIDNVVERQIKSMLELIVLELAILKRKVSEMAKSLDDVLAEVTAQGTKLDGITTLISGLKQQLADALAGTTLPPAVQAKVDAIFNQASQNAAKIDTALDANVPPTP